jgi:hypothetical protein
MNFVAVILFMLNICALAEPGGREGGGGSIDEMRKAGSLTATQIYELIKNNGILVKSQVLNKIPINIKASSIDDLDVAEIYLKMTEGSIPLQDDITYSIYKTHCECPMGKDMCTFNKNFADICIDVPALVNRKVSFPEFIGLLMHEHSHHYVGELDHQYNYAFGKFMEKEAKGDHLFMNKKDLK